MAAYIVLASGTEQTCAASASMKVGLQCKWQARQYTEASGSFNKGDVTVAIYAVYGKSSDVYGTQNLFLCSYSSITNPGIWINNTKVKTLYTRTDSRNPYAASVTTSAYKRLYESKSSSTYLSMELKVGTAVKKYSVPIAIRGFLCKESDSIVIEPDILEVTVSFTSQKLSTCSVYNGTAWADANAYVFNGTEWVEATPMIYNGTAWVTCS